VVLTYQHECGFGASEEVGGRLMSILTRALSAVDLLDLSVCRPLIERIKVD